MIVDFLAAVARTALTGSFAPLHWPDGGDVVHEAFRHGLIVQLDRVAPSIDGMPDEERRRLRDLCLHWSRRSLAMAAQLRTVLDTLRAAEIDCLPVKGPLLAATAYGHPAARGPLSDLDLVVRPRDFRRAIDALTARGYRRIEWTIDERWEGEAHIFPAEGSGDALIELHTELGYPGTTPLDLEGVFARSTETAFLGSRVRVAAPEDMLLYLCMHGSQHMWSRFQWVCDVAAMIEANPALSWPDVEARANAIGARQRLAFGQHLAKALLGVGPGGDVPRWLVRLARHRMEIEHPRRLTVAVSELAAYESARERWAFFVGLLKPTASDLAWIKLPRPLSWLYFVLRPLRILTTRQTNAAR